MGRAFLIYEKRPLMPELLVHMGEKSRMMRDYRGEDIYSKFSVESLKIRGTGSSARCIL